VRPILIVLALAVPSIVAAGLIPASGGGTYSFDNGTDPSSFDFTIGGSDGTDSFSLNCQELSPFFGNCPYSGTAAIDGQGFEGGNIRSSFVAEAGPQTAEVEGYADGVVVAEESFTTVGQVVSMTGAGCSGPFFDLGCEETLAFAAPSTAPEPGSLTTIAGGLTVLLLIIRESFGASIQLR
jgi:hypothetical protein